MGKAQKVYVVWVGREPGIYHTWEACEKQVKGYVGARYKSFATHQLAQEAFASPIHSTSTVVKNVVRPVRRPSKLVASRPTGPALVVDAACSGVPGPVEWRGLSLATMDEVFHSLVYQYGTNNVGEFLAIVQGIRWLVDRSKKWPIYSDSANAILWVKKKHCNTNLVQTAANTKLFAAIEDAELFLSNTKHGISIKKWETQCWGENPADFGRK